MDAVTRTIIANVERRLAEMDCAEFCGVECRGWCRRPVLSPPPEPACVEEQLAVAATPEPQLELNAALPVVIEDSLSIPIVIYTPSQLFVDGDPAKAFRARTTGTPGTTTWDGLVRMLSRAPEGDPSRYADPNVQKAARGGWSACALKNGRRLGEAFVETRLLGLDIDNNGEIEKALAAFAPFKKIVHSTYKSTAEAPRCRVVLLLKEPCRDADAFRRAHRALRQGLVRAGWFRAEDFDDAGSDPSRLWFLPMVPPGVPYAFHVTEGALLDLRKLVPNVASEKPTIRKSKNTKTTSTNGAGALVWADRRMSAASEGQRHTRAFSLSAWLAEISPPIPEPEIEAMLMRHAPEGREAEFERTIADGIRRGRAA